MHVTMDHYERPFPHQRLVLGGADDADELKKEDIWGIGGTTDGTSPGPDFGKHKLKSKDDTSKQRSDWAVEVLIGSPVNTPEVLVSSRRRERGNGIMETFVNNGPLARSPLLKTSETSPLSDRGRIPRRPSATWTIPLSRAAALLALPRVPTEVGLSQIFGKRSLLFLASPGRNDTLEGAFLRLRVSATCKQSYNGGVEESAKNPLAAALQEQVSGEVDEEDRMHEECGVVGVYGDAEASRLYYLALHALQHKRARRGGHSDIQRDLSTGRGLSVVGNVQLEESGSIFNTTSDTVVILHLIATSRDQHLLARIIHACEQIEGAYLLVFLSEDKLVAVQDPYGFRPLMMGRWKNGAVVFASETCLLEDPYGFRPLMMGRWKNGAVVFASETCVLDLIETDYSGACIEAPVPARHLYQHPIVCPHFVFEVLESIRTLLWQCLRQMRLMVAQPCHSLRAKPTLFRYG
ncbi:hypothetical protein GOP47_0002117 [Adiantum capillus-veneris]|uniref:Glutamine amidotransferase type-2 domain-containing protein n=1 Tax=Adiantum capillus-veneris TaxID=13818 RepID=A0A9D4ZNW5_ADICA|nr:hypothetical protein GOP47_0002117 [Adiantum capillus-veneris]